VIPSPNAAQKKELLDDLGRHSRWPAANCIAELVCPLSEDAYTGLLLAALLEPDAGPVVGQGLLAGSQGAAHLAEPRTVSAAQWPTRGADLVVLVESGADSEVLIVEHKRFRSPSHASGYRRDPRAPWQTDQVSAAVTSSQRPSWLSGFPSHPKTRFIVLDAYGKIMEQLFPAGQFNDHWLVTGYPQFGSVLRAAHARRVRGLVPLPTGLYAGC
jgi:hypothetical protein